MGIGGFVDRLQEPGVERKIGFCGTRGVEAETVAVRIRRTPSD
jgi:hypothetical protein